jgi:hypothetical protein
METVGDIDYHSQMALAARQKADATDDPDLALRLREAAIKHERRVRTLRRLGAGRSGLA